MKPRMWHGPRTINEGGVTLSSQESIFFPENFVCFREITWLIFHSPQESVHVASEWLSISKRIKPSRISFTLICRKRFRFLYKRLEIIWILKTECYQFSTSLWGKFILESLRGWFLVWSDSLVLRFHIYHLTPDNHQAGEHQYPGAEKTLYKFINVNLPWWSTIINMSFKWKAWTKAKFHFVKEEHRLQGRCTLIPCPSYRTRTECINVVA